MERASDNFFGGDSAGAGGFGTEGSLGISADGRFVVFASNGNDLVAPGLDPTRFGGVLQTDVFVRDRVTNTTTIVSQGFGGVAANNASSNPAISRNGRYVAFESKAINLLAVPTGDFFTKGIYVRDLQTGTTELASVGLGGAFPNSEAKRPSISDDGNLVTFRSYASNMMSPGPGACGLDYFAAAIFVYDRSSGTTTCASLNSNGTQLHFDPSGDEHSTVISGDGRFVGFAGLLVGPSTDPGFPDFRAFVRDRATGQTESISVAFDGSKAGGVDFGGFSTDGRFAVFSSFDSNLLAPGKDTNGLPDVFVRDRRRGITERVSVASDGTQSSSHCHLALGNQAISPDGRFVLFSCLDGANLVPGSVGIQIYRHDRASGTTEQVSVAADGTLGTTNGFGTFPVISADGQTVAYHTGASNLRGPGTDLNNLSDVYVRGLDQTDPLGVDPLLFPDGVLDDMVLEVIDATTGAVTTQCPAGDVSVAGSNAAYLRPESAIGTLACPGNSLNSDMDVDDQVVQLVQGAGATQNLGLAATAIAASATRIAALVSEPGENASILNSDGDAFDQVLHVYSIAGAAWTNVGQAADAIAISGDRIAFITPEAAQGAGSLNGPADTDTSDRVAQVYDAATASLTNLGQAVEELVLGNATGTICGPRHLVAMRSNEAAQGAGPLNGDGDTLDDVLVVYDFVTNVTYELGYAVTPCHLEVCDPHKPYNVNGGEVRFLTYEPDQNQDLDGNGTIGGIVLQSFDVCTGIVRVIGAVAPDSKSDPLRPVDESQVFSVAAGRCAGNPPVTCSQEADCGAGSFCNIVTGYCTLTTPPTCRATADCPADALCVPQRVTVAAGVRDIDDDGVPDDLDNCPSTPNPLQTDIDLDGVGNACDLANCGDAVRQTSEQCDGADASTCPGLCKANCLCPFCGDNQTDAGEECDGSDNAACGGHGCQANCACVPNVCGDGLVGGAEECDGSANAGCGGMGCQASCLCVPIVCGDGVTAGMEQCDDGNVDDHEACKNDCTVNLCGNGQLDAPEICDDGNQIDGDTCTRRCKTNTKEIGICQVALGASMQKYFQGRIQALQSCRAALNKGKPRFFDKLKTMPFTDPALCVNEYATATKLAKRALSIRATLAKKCSDAALDALSACASTVDGVVAALGTSGCLLTTQTAVVDTLIDGEYERALNSTETTQYVCQTTIANAGRVYAKKRLSALRICRNDLNKGKLRFADKLKTMAIHDPALCVTEYGVAGKIAKAGQALRNAIAKPTKCTDALVLNLASTCANTIDGLVDATGTAGCLVTDSNGAADTLIDSAY